MKPNPSFLNQPKFFWANVRSVSQHAGYTERGTGRIMVPGLSEMSRALNDLGLGSSHIVDSNTTVMFMYMLLRSVTYLIPTIGVMKRNANETSAINSVQAIIKAEIQYESSFPANGYACSLQALGGDTGSTPPTPQSAQLIQSDLASGYKSGYIFNITNCTKVTVNNTDRITGFTVTAVPQAVGKTGNRGFCSDENGGAPKYDPTGGTNCTQLLQ